MLFNTFIFMLVFLPLSLLSYFAISKRSLRLSITFLMVASLVFYSYWQVSFLGLLLGSIAVNYIVGRLICREKEAGKGERAKLALLVGLVFNLGLLCLFKYLDFLARSLAWLLGADYTSLGITLPIGISFFSFTQIAYLVDCYVGKVREYRIENYALFVSYFPHLIAGPILHHKEMMPQFEDRELHVFRVGRLVVGTFFVVIGLFKKVVLADGLSRYVGPVFDVHFSKLTAIEAWCGALAYTFQLYFDFSAYCDMAYGMSYMLGIILPINFNSPYKATSIVDFWRRWHMTLSRFLRDYLYVPLGGNRRGAARRYANLMITMLLGGLWHGANWTFVIWGGLHGLYLALNHAVRKLLGAREGVLVALSGWLLTFLGVVVGWVFFRARSMDVAIGILRAMTGGGSGATVSGSPIGINRIMAIDECALWIGACAAIAFFTPNLYAMIGPGIRNGLEARLGSLVGGIALGAAVIGGVVLLAISETRGVSEFLYFNF